MRSFVCAALIALCLLVQGSDAWADSRRLFFQTTQQLSQEQQTTLVRFILHGEDEPVDAAAHALFWSQFSDQDRLAWIAAEGSDQSPAARILVFQRIETAFRQSLYETVASDTIVRTRELDELRAQVPGSRADPKDPWTQQIGRQDRLLDPVRLRASKYASRFPIVAFDQWNAARRALLQAELLLRSEWAEPEIIPWPYPALHLTLDWTYPLAMHPSVLCELPCSAWLMGHAFDDQKAAIVFHYDGVAHLQDQFESSDRRVGMNLMTDLRRSYQVSEQSREDGAWQGYPSSVFRSSIKLDDRPSYHVVRILVREQFGDAFVILGVSSRSMSEAEDAFDHIDQAIHLD